jgi:hydrogenase maturation protease
VTSSSPEKDVVVIGLGNMLMSDEGIGAHLVQKLSNLRGKFPNVDFIDAGTGGMNVLYMLENRRKAVIIDCANMDLRPGDIRKFTPAHVQSTKALAHYSLHEQDLLQIINLAKKLDKCPKNIIIFGIQPETTGFGSNLSKKLLDKIDDYISLICGELVEI